MSAALLYQQMGLNQQIDVPIPKKKKVAKRKRTKPKCLNTTRTHLTVSEVPLSDIVDQENLPSVANGSDNVVSRKCAQLDDAAPSRVDHVTSGCSNERAALHTCTDASALVYSPSSTEVTEVKASSGPCIVASSLVYVGDEDTAEGFLTSDASNVVGKKRSASLTVGSGKELKKKKKKTKQTSVEIVDQSVEMISNKQQRDGLSGKVEAKQLFEWMIHPVNPDQFFKELWEKKPLLIKRHNSSYNDGWFSSKEFSEILNKNPIQFGTHLDLTSYREGSRETHNIPGRAYPHLVWKHYRNGGSVRMLNPQTYSEKVWLLLNTLQDFFRSTMGANVYLTPAGTQGFAPHYDDIEAFMIQLEGKKHWRLYAPRSDKETLPISSSQNFSQSDLGKPILDTILEAGDMLYFPRGTIHQGNCLPDSHSLHITVSTYQMNTWGDLLEKLLPKALTIAREEDVAFRTGLPLEYLDYTGISKSEIVSPSRATFLKTVEELMGRLVRYAPVDAAADDLSAKLIHDSLPPHPDRRSVAHHISECSSSGETTEGPTVTASSRVRLSSPYCARVMAHEDCISLQHSCSNTRLFHEIDPQEIDYPADYGPALEMLTNTYPHFVEIKSLPLPTKTSVELIQELADMNIVQVLSKQSNGFISSIKSKVKRSTAAPDKIRGRPRKGSGDDIPIKLRRESHDFSKTMPIKLNRPSSGQFDPPNYRKAKTLQPKSALPKSSEQVNERKFSYGRCGESNSAMLTEV